METIDTCGMCYISREIHPDVKRYTWRRKNPLKQARLDYAIGTNSLLDITKSCKILPGYRSDHSRIELDLLMDPFIKGKGIWRFNCSLLKNIDYIKSVKEWIREVKKQYIIPVYNLQNIDQIDEANIQFSISDSMFLEMLLLAIRGKTIKFSSNLAKIGRQKENTLTREIEQLEKQESETNLNMINSKKQELEKLRETETRGFMIRSRIQNIQLNEKPSKFFCNLEKSKYVDKTIKKLKLDDGKYLNSQQEILDNIRQYYSNLFSCKDDGLVEKDLHDLYTTKRKLSKEEARNLDGMITISELGAVLKNMKNNKTPGIDGFPADFFKVFWKDFKIYIQRCLNESYRNKILPCSLRQAVICCLPKGNKARDSLKNWRPISLLSVLYKMATGVIANRLKGVLLVLISKSQTGFIKGRFIGESTRLVYDIMNYTVKGYKWSYHVN